MAGALAMLVLMWRTRDFYKGDIYAKFKEGEGSKLEEDSCHVEEEEKKKIMEKEVEKLSEITIKENGKNVN